MEKEKLLKYLAENGYNILFGAKKHFATYDIVEKMPGRVAFLTLAIGIWQIYKPLFIYNQEVSLLLILAGIVALTISQYNGNKETYKEVAIQLTQMHNALKEIYYKVQASEDNHFEEELDQVKDVLEKYYQVSISKQILLSDWYAHYKFFWQSQHEWIDEQKKFSLKDKFPLSFILSIITVIALFLAILLLQ